MVREYIGARYVPKFMETYDVTQDYEALCVVDNGQGTSYITKIPTPAGTPLTDTTHWAIYGASSGAILNLQNQINNMNDGSVPGSLQNQITDNKNDIAQLASDTDNMFKDLHSIDVSNMANRIFVFVGDSYTQVPLPSTSFVGKVVNNLGLTSNQYHNIGVSGQGLDGYKLQVDNYAYDDANDVTDVVITGGVNDAHDNISDPSTIETKIDGLYVSVVTKFPKATIWAGFSGGGYYRALSGTYTGFNYDNMMFLKFIWKNKWATKAKCIYMDDLDLWARSLSDTDFYLSGGNGLHPYGFGISTLGGMISNYLKGGALSLNDLTSIDCPIVAATTLDVNVWNLPSAMKVTKRGRTSHIFLGYGSVSFNTPISLHYGSGIQLAKMVVDNQAEVLAVYINKRISCPSFVWYTTDGTNYNIMPIEIRIDGAAISFLAYPGNPPITGVTAMFFPGFDISCPTDIIL